MKKAKVLVLLFIFALIAGCGQDIEVEKEEKVNVSDLAILKEKIAKTNISDKQLVCSELFPGFKALFEQKKNISELIDITKQIPEIKNCEDFSGVEDVLKMATGYKNVPWGSSVEYTKSKLGNFTLKSPYKGSYRGSEGDHNYDGNSIKNDIFSDINRLSDNLFCQVYWSDEADRCDNSYEEEKGKITTRKFWLYVGKDSQSYLFKNNKFFAFKEYWPCANNAETAYLEALTAKHGKSRILKGDKNAGPYSYYYRDLYVWDFGNTYILYNSCSALYVDNQAIRQMQEEYRQRLKDKHDKENALKARMQKEVENKISSL